MSEEKDEKKETRLIDRFLSPKEGDTKQTTIIERFRSGNGPVRDFFKQQKVTEETLSGEQQNLAKAFREGIADAIGIPVENIDEISIVRWILEFTRSFVKPENLKDTIVPPERRLRMFGHEIGSIVRQAIEQLDKEPKPKSIVEKILNKPTEVVKTTKSDGDKSLDISLG